VNWRLVLVGLVIGEQSDGHGKTLRDLSTESGEAHPNAERIKAITDDSDLDEVVATERHLLYVACTRARDHLLITSGDTCSEFVEDLLPGLCN